MKILPIFCILMLTFAVTSCEKNETESSNLAVVEIPERGLFRNRIVNAFDDAMKGIAASDDVEIELFFPKGDKTNSLYVEHIEVLDGSITFYSEEGGITLMGSNKVECWLNTSHKRKTFSFHKNKGPHINVVCGRLFNQGVNQEEFSASLNITVPYPDSEYTRQTLPYTITDDALRVKLKVTTSEDFRGHISGAVVPFVK